METFSEHLQSLNITKLATRQSRQHNVHLCWISRKLTYLSGRYWFVTAIYPISLRAVPSAAVGKKLGGTIEIINHYLKVDSIWKYILYIYFFFESIFTGTLKASFYLSSTGYWPVSAQLQHWLLQEKVAANLSRCPGSTSTPLDGNSVTGFF